MMWIPQNPNAPSTAVGYNTTFFFSHDALQLVDNTWSENIDAMRCQWRKSARAVILVMLPRAHGSAVVFLGASVVLRQPVFMNDQIKESLWTRPYRQQYRFVEVVRTIKIRTAASSTFNIRVALLWVLDTAKCLFASADVLCQCSTLHTYAYVRTKNIIHT